MARCATRERQKIWRFCSNRTVKRLLAYAKTVAARKGSTKGGKRCLAIAGPKSDRLLGSLPYPFNPALLMPFGKAD